MNIYNIFNNLIEEDNQLKIYGAGIISSKGETEHCLSKKAKQLPFDIQTIFDTDYRTDVFQERYFVIHSFQQLLDSLNEIELRLHNSL